MNKQEKKAWEECVERVKRSCKLELLPTDNVYSLVLSADAELTLLRAIAERAEDVEGMRLLLKRTVEFWPDDAGKAAYAIEAWLEGKD